MELSGIGIDKMELTPCLVTMLDETQAQSLERNLASNYMSLIIF